MYGLLSKLTNQKNETFLQRREHSWFSDNPLIKETFSKLYTVITPYKNIYSLFNSLIFVQSNGQYACTVNADVNIVIIFPELTFLMKNGNKDQAISVLLHEIGHIILEHQKKCTPNQQAQIEADFFAVELGFGKDLYAFLLSQRSSPQIQNRIEALNRFIDKT